MRPEHRSESYVVHVRKSTTARLDEILVTHSKQGVGCARGVPHRPLNLDVRENPGARPAEDTHVRHRR
ncbi:hypothetical protein GCM10009608_78850 [Pseudonocardia alaniniphila]